MENFETRFYARFSALLSFLFSPQGRVNRKPMWILLGITLLFMPLIILLRTVFLEKVLVLGIFWLCPIMKRFDDRGWERCLAFLLFLGPILLHFVFLAGLNLIGSISLIIWLPFFIWSLIELFFRHGTLGPDAYGPDPLEIK